MTLTVPEDVQILSEFRPNESVILTKRWVRQIIHKMSSYDTGILEWKRTYLEKGRIGLVGRYGILCTSHGTVQLVQYIFEDDPTLRIASDSFRF